VKLASSLSRKGHAGKVIPKQDEAQKLTLSNNNINTMQNVHVKDTTSGSFSVSSSV